MRRTQSRTAAAVTAVAAGAVAVYAIQPADTTVATVAARAPAVQYRTQVIRRTIHIVRHDRHAFPTPRGAVAAGGRGPHGKGAIKTGASGSHARAGGGGAGAGTAGVVTRSSGHSSAGASPGSSSSAGHAGDDPHERLARL